MVAVWLKQQQRDWPTLRTSFRHFVRTFVKHISKNSINIKYVGNRDSITHKSQGEISQLKSASLSKAGAGGQDGLKHSRNVTRLQVLIQPLDVTIPSPDSHGEVGGPAGENHAAVEAILEVI